MESLLTIMFTILPSQNWVSMTRKHFLGQDNIKLIKPKKRLRSSSALNNILNDMILPTITVKKKPKKKEEKRKKKKSMSMKRAFNKLRPSLEVNRP